MKIKKDKLIRRIRAWREWVMDSPRRFITTGIVAVVALTLLVVIGQSLWVTAGLGLIWKGKDAQPPMITATVAPRDPHVVATGDPLGMPRGPQDGQTTDTHGHTVAPTWAPTTDPDRTDPSAVAQEFMRRWLDGAGHGLDQAAAWRARLVPLASPGFRVDLGNADPTAVPTADLTGAGSASTVGERASLSMTLSTGQLAVVELVKINDASGGSWAVSGVTLSGGS